MPILLVLSKEVKCHSHVIFCCSVRYRGTQKTLTCKLFASRAVVMHKLLLPRQLRVKSMLPSFVAWHHTVSSTPIIIFEKSFYTPHSFIQHRVSSPFIFTVMYVSSLFSKCWLPLLTFQGSLHSLLHRQHINKDEFQLRNYFPLLKNEQHFEPHNRRSNFLSSSSLCKPNM